MRIEDMTKEQARDFFESYVSGTDMWYTRMAWDWDYFWRELPEQITSCFEIPSQAPRTFKGHPDRHYMYLVNEVSVIEADTMPLHCFLSFDLNLFNLRPEWFEVIEALPPVKEQVPELSALAKEVLATVLDSHGYFSIVKKYGDAQWDDPESLEDLVSRRWGGDIEDITFTGAVIPYLKGIRMIDALPESEQQQKITTEIKSWVENISQCVQNTATQIIHDQDDWTQTFDYWYDNAVGNEHEITDYITEDQADEYTLSLNDA